MQAVSNPICNVCQSGDTQIKALLQSEIDGKEYNAVQCEQCELIFASPAPELSINALQNIYDVDYVENQRKISSSPHALTALRNGLNRQMDIVEKYVEKGLALNVGAINGYVDKVIEERGWKLKFLEVSTYAAETARQLWDLDVTVSRLEDFKCPPYSFDFVKLGHVVEHLVDPTLALRKLSKILKPGGVVLIDTDNANGLKTKVEVFARRLLGEDLSARLIRKLTKKNLRKRYGRLTPPEHLYCFSEKSLNKLLRDSGFEIMTTFKPAWGDPTWFPLTQLDGFSTVEKTSIKIDQVGAKFGYGDVIVALAKKL